jgi:hypothetical protein
MNTSIILNKIKIFFSNKKKVLILSLSTTVCLSVYLYFYLIASPHNLKVIPKEAKAIVVIDPISIFKKGNFYEILEIKGIKNIKDKSEENEIAKKLQKDINYTGIDITSDIFGFLLVDNDQEAYTCLAISIKCEDNFEKSFDYILNEMPDLFHIKSDENLKFKIKKEKKFKYAISNNNNIAVAWDNKKAVIIRPLFENKFLKKKVIKLMQLKEDDQITNSKEFNSFYSNKKEISLWLSTEHLKKNIISKDGPIQKLISDYNEIKYEEFDNKTLESLKIYEDKFTSLIKNSLPNNYISVFLSFEENYFSLKVSSKLNSNMQDLISDLNILHKKFNVKLLDYFPEKNIFFKFLEELEPDIKTLLPFSPNTEILEAFNESIVFTLHGFDNIKIRKRDYKNDKYYFTEDGFDYYEAYKFENIKSILFSSALDINDKDKILNYLDTSSTNLEYKNSYYTQYILNEIPIYFNINENNILYITNDTSKILQFVSGKEMNYNESLSNSKTTKNIKNNFIYGKLDISISFDIIKKYLSLSINEQITQIEQDFYSFNSYEDLNEKQNLETKLKQLKKIKQSLDVLDTEINNFAKKIGSSIEYEYSDINTFEIKFHTPNNGKNSLNNLSLAIVEAFIYSHTFKSIMN